MHAITLEKIHPRMKAALEIILGILIIFIFEWRIYPEYKSWKHLVFLLMLLGLLIYSKQSHRESWKDLGFRLDTWAPSFKKILIISLPVVTILTVIWSQAFAINLKFYKQSEFWIQLSTYPFWALIQQYIALAFFFRRLRDVFFPHYVPAFFLSAVLFSSAHLPNLPLVFFSFFGGLLWSWIYHRYNNLVTIILFHGIIGTFLSAILMVNFSVGPLTDSFRLTRNTPVHCCVDHINSILARKKFFPIEIRKTDTVITVDGWVAGKKSKVENVSIIMNRKEFVCTYGFQRKDVAIYYNNPQYEYSGFQVNIPLADIKPGYYQLKLKISLQGITYPHYPSDKIWVKIKP
jgi:membrane protease YdiL (CAAX protease family)